MRQCRSTEQRSDSQQYEEETCSRRGEDDVIVDAMDESIFVAESTALQFDLSKVASVPSTIPFSSTTLHRISSRKCKQAKEMTYL